ncbi:heavy metal translocating P-type ATPase [Bacillus sp. AFS055030]|uniref:heavy metal translocating P-type ATPase n=1 Tax=Bacillus sp. AFS055030 TaxID=2033507 RepID=UPI000BFCF272|nr:heavy metal translocating P-type ATPase [Bacillus sp. AFS055030]PGL72679.1 heavy metal translocating P-type ATPase [Bacillus sp. AFS055030]
MEASPKVTTIHATYEADHVESTSFLSKHGELIAALVSGVLILIASFVKNDSSIMSIILYVLAFCIGGYAKAKEGIEDTIAEKELNVEMLMIIAAVGSAAIGYWTEGAVLIFIFALSGALETYTLNKTNKEISSLLSLQPQTAIRLVDDVEEVVGIKSLNIGDYILIKAGERIPADGQIVKGETLVDEAALTGESIPVVKNLNDEVFAGTINIKGTLVVEITKHSDETLFQKIINLVQTAQSEQTPSQQFIEKFEGVYVKGVLIAVLLMMFLPHFALDWSWTTTFYRAMILLVVASPCALVASITPAVLSAISNGAKSGILVKGGIHLERLGVLKAIAFDKTGTLTIGKPEVTGFEKVEDFDRTALLSIVASIEKYSTHPLAAAIVEYAMKQGITVSSSFEQIDDHPGFGVSAILNGTEYRVGKKEFVTMKQNPLIQFEQQWEQEGNTIVYVGTQDQVVAIFSLKDLVRNESKQALSTLNKLGVQTVMITGDSEQTAKAIAAESEINEYFASCLPDEKVSIVKKLKDNYGQVAMVGDGINDAPALATANVGIAMGGGTGVALETADVVLMKNDLTKISKAITLSKRMNKIVKQNIIFSLSIIAFLICSNFLQIIDLPYGVIGHEGSTILVILNSLRLLRD